MLPLINQAMLAGYTVKQILGFLKNKIPGLKQGIETAESAGFDENKILKFLSNKIPKNRDKIPQQENENDRYLSSIGIKTKREREETRNKYLQGALGVGAGILGTAALAKPIKSIGSSIAKNIGFNPPTGSSASISPQSSLVAPLLPTGQPPISSQNIQLPSTQTIPSGQVPSQPPIPNNVQNTTQNITQPPQTIQPKEISVNVGEILNKHASKEKIDELIKSGNGPEAISAYFNKFHPKEAKNIEKEAGKPLQEAIQDYTQQASMQTQEQTSVEPISQELDVSEEASQGKDLLNEARKLFQETGNLSTTFMQRKLKIGYADAARLVDQLKSEGLSEESKDVSTKLEKGSTVATDLGIGEIKSISGNNALVEEDGKVKQYDLDDLVQSPLPKKDLADLFDDLNRGIEKETGEEISRMANWAGYNPKTNTLAFLPHIGALYTYKDITPEQAKLLTSFLVKRKSTGENFIGPWVEGSKSPIGAAMSALIKELQAQRGGKGQEYDEKFETIYDAQEPAKLAAREKKKKKKKKKNE